MNWWQVTGLMLIAEAMLPFISPAIYRAMVAQISTLSDRQLRWIGLGLLLIGTGLVVFAR